MNPLHSTYVIYNINNFFFNCTISLFTSDYIYLFEVRQ